MTAPDFTIKQGADSPSLAGYLEDEEGTAFDLSGGGAATFRMWRQRDSTLVVDQAAVIVTADEGLVRYDWDGTPSTGTESADEYFAEFVGENAAGRIAKFPAERHLWIRVHPAAPGA